MFSYKATQKSPLDFLTDLIFRDPAKVSIHEALSLGLIIGSVLGILFLMILLALITFGVFVYMLLDRCCKSALDNFSGGTLLLAFLAIGMAIFLVTYCVQNDKFQELWAGFFRFEKFPNKYARHRLKALSEICFFFSHLRRFQKIAKCTRVPIFIYFLAVKI